MRDRASLSLQSPDGGEPARGHGRRLTLVLLTFLILLAAGLGFLGYQVLQRAGAIEQKITSLSAQTSEAATLSRQAIERAAQAEASAAAAAQGRQQAEAEKAGARQEADTARQEADAAREEATSARETASRAQAEADRIRKRAEAEMKRLETALDQVAETHSTALGLVMRLGSDYLKFEFDKADLRPADRELLSRVAGILMTSQDYTLSVNGHTDDVGSDAYNQKLSERRAQAVRDYLVSVGLRAEILSVTGHGKARPLVQGTSDEARARNRRVELGIVNMKIHYGPAVKQDQVVGGPPAPADAQSSASPPRP